MSPLFIQFPVFVRGTTLYIYMSDLPFAYVFHYLKKKRKRSYLLFDVYMLIMMGKTMKHLYV